jgi:hypothetical protein
MPIGCGNDGGAHEHESLDGTCPLSGVASGPHQLGAHNSEGGPSASLMKPFMSLWWSWWKVLPPELGGTAPQPMLRRSCFNLLVDLEESKVSAIIGSE